jgi:hypothetical protein
VCQIPRPTQVHKDLQSCPYVFVRVDSVRKPLQPPYDGPFKVIQRRDKYFLIDRNGHQDAVNIDRLKVAFVEPSAQADNNSLPTHIQPTTPTTTTSTSKPYPTLPSPVSLPTVPSVKQTRFGRILKPSTLLTGYVS